MPAINYALFIEQGVPFSASILLKNPDDTPKDLSGFTAKMHLRQYKSHPDVLLELSTENSKITVNPSGEVTLNLSATDTSSLLYSSVVYDLLLINGENTFRAVEGKVTVSGSVTTNTN